MIHAIDELLDSPAIEHALIPGPEIVPVDLRPPRLERPQ
jgi:hypothetical protein